MAVDDEIDRLHVAGAVSLDHAENAKRVLDEIASTALGKLICVGAMAADVVPAYAKAFALTPATSEQLAMISARPPLPEALVDELAALPAAVVWNDAGGADAIVGSVQAAEVVAQRAASLPQPCRVLLCDEPRLLSLLDRVLALSPQAEPPAARRPHGAGREETAPTAKAERFLARPVREVDRRPGKGTLDPANPISFIPAGAVPPEQPAAPTPSTPPPAARPRPKTGEIADGAQQAQQALARAAAGRPKTGEIADGAQQAAAALAAAAPAAPSTAPAGRGVPKAALVGGGAVLALIVLVIVVKTAVGIGGHAKGADSSSSAAAGAQSGDKRAARLAEARALEAKGDLAWAIAAYAEVASGNDALGIDARIGLASANAALGDRAAALAGLAEVQTLPGASSEQKQRAAALAEKLRMP